MLLVVLESFASLQSLSEIADYRDLREGDVREKKNGRWLSSSGHSRIHLSWTTHKEGWSLEEMRKIGGVLLGSKRDSFRFSIAYVDQKVSPDIVVNNEEFNGKELVKEIHDQSFRLRIKFGNLLRSIGWEWNSVHHGSEGESVVWGWRMKDTRKLYGISKCGLLIHGSCSSGKLSILPRMDLQDLRDRFLRSGENRFYRFACNRLNHT